MVLRTVIVGAALAALTVVPLSVATARTVVTQTAQYKLTFTATWSAQTHPQSFPPGPHFSGLIGGTHDASTSFWDVGQLASPGIQNMAETGSKAPLDAEINAAIQSGTAEHLISGSGVSPSPGSVSVSFAVSQSHPRVTVVTMVAPSPDWFTGVSGLELFAGGDWLDQIAVDVFAYDAGTDGGVLYTSANAPLSPHVAIAQAGFPFTPGAKLGTFTFTREDSAPPFVDLGNGFPGVNGVPVLGGVGLPAPGLPFGLALSSAAPHAPVVFIVGLQQANAPALGGTLVPQPDLILPIGTTGPGGGLDLPLIWPANLPGLDQIVAQMWIQDAGAAFGFAASNGLCISTP